MATGRTVPKFAKFQFDDSGGTMRDAQVSTINGIGLAYEEENGLVALNDLIKGALSGLPDLDIDIGGPFSNLAAASAYASGAAPAFTGSHNLFDDLPGGVTPLGFGFYIGIQSLWSTGDPVFGLSASGTDGLLCFNYLVDLSSMTYTARFRMVPGSALPAWGTSAIS